VTALFTQDQIEDIRRRTSLVSLVGRTVKLRRSGRGWNGLCPFHKEKTPSFTVSDERGFYHCFGCAAHGDVFEWMMQAHGLSFREAIEQLAAGELPKGGGRIERREVERPHHHDVVGSATVGRWIWNSAGPARGEIVEAWLRSRGLDPLVELAPGFAPIDRLRFHPRCPVVPWKAYQGPEDAWLTAPAMVAPISDAAGAVWGVHCTYLRADGRDKAALPKAQGKERPTRKMWGALGGHAVWLTPPGEGDGLPLVVGEGIETVWAYAQSIGTPCRAAAALSLQNLQGSAKRIRGGALPLWRPEYDDERSPPFLVPDAGDVIVLVDADMKPLREQKVQLERGAAPIVADISGLQRAELCATLASQAWRGAGARSVKAVRPRMGMDFNDAIRSAA
jgi:hypothetical protein